MQLQYGCKVCDKLGKKEKLLKKLNSCPKDFTFDEMLTLLSLLGYEQSNKGKTSGSRVKFWRNTSIIMFHKPHPGNELPMYQIKQIIKALSEEGLI